jgi:hypothetical protein
MRPQKYTFIQTSLLSKLKCLLISGCLIPLICIAQVQENFSDGNFTENPAWAGDVSQFLVNPDFVLQSNADSLGGTSNTVYLSTDGYLAGSTQWEFFVNPKLSTSSNNLMDVYLLSDVSNLKGSVNGYFIRTGGTPDEVALFRKDGLTEVKIITGKQNAINGTTNNPTKIKVIRKSDGKWLLYADYEGSGAAFEQVGSVQDLTYTSGPFTGLLVRYSNSNRLKFFFDDFYIGPEVIDSLPPVVIDVNVTGEQEIELIYSENIDPSSAVNTENFSVNKSIGEPLSASGGSTRPNAVSLRFNGVFPVGEVLTLSCSGVRDLAGNVQLPSQHQFVYYRPKPFDVVINEVMADPDPPVKLPNIEYVELHNRSSFPINIGGWFIRVGTNTKVLPQVKVLPDSFLVLTSFTGEALYNDSVAVAGVVAMPSLTNTGAQISLLDAAGEVMSAVSYSDQWYGSSIKQAGGWSLEQISPLLPCGGELNWAASVNQNGGTPGRRNSVWQPITDQQAPAIERVAVIAPDTIRVFFNESVLKTEAADTAVYSIDQGTSVRAALPETPDFKTVKLVLSPPLQVGLLYELSVSEKIKDCSGNEITEVTRAKFAIPSVCLPNDIVINEILSDPKDGGSDYIELYNRSQKIIDLAGLQLGSRDTLSGELTDSKIIAPQGFLCFPGQYVLITADPAGVSQFYAVPSDASVVNLSGMAAFNNESGVVTLSRASDFNQIDQVVYRSELHFSFLNSLDGVSLERVNYDRPSGDPTNWNSAASVVGYGTPGYKNSQFSPLVQPGGAEMAISPAVFSPDSDGFDDVVNIGYSFKAPGFTGSVTIFDANGRLVKYLARNLLFGAEGQLSWNGINEDQEKSRIGIYIAYLEAFTLDGQTVAIKKPFVLGGKL